MTKPQRGNQPPFEREVAFSEKMAEGAFGSLTHRLFWLPPSPPVGSADSPLPERASQSVTEPRRDRLSLQMPCGHLSIAVAMAYHQPLGLDIIKAGALYIIARSVHILALQF